jgi:UDP-N-acetylmuramate: L-alanyl-gamma-D-glutamyl-meso-diaminopimelate ligase
MPVNQPSGPRCQRNAWPHSSVAARLKSVTLILRVIFATSSRGESYVTLNKEVNSLHFVGIAGTAMASVAALCRERGYAVTGSDENVYPPMSTFLEARDIRIMTGYREANLNHRPELVVIGNAMKRGNPEVERVLDERLNYCSLPELLREFFIRGKHSIVVAGTHGKTTTAALFAWVLESAGLAPGFLVGGIPNNFGCGARFVERASSPLGAKAENGQDARSTAYFVVEGDEYDTAFFDKRSKFVHYLPDMVILNNIEFDHADIFPDLAAVKRAFRQLVAIVPRRGLIIANGKDANVREVVAGAECRVRYFGLPDFAGYRIPLVGEHNQRNAAAVVVGASELGLSREQIQAGFDTFTGVKRRMEVRGEAAGVTVLDDFAHHPTAIAETIRAIRGKYPRRRLWALFEPRSNTTRRNVFQGELAESLGLADGVFIARVDRMNELPENEQLKPEQIVATLLQRGMHAQYAADAEGILTELVPRLRDSDVVAVFSNGKFDGIHDKLLARLRT